MEILDPRTKSCTFLTLKHYVGELGKFERAQCLLEKNEPFMTSENLWIAAESFKVSVAPNPQGLVYCNIPKSYFISADEMNPDGAPHSVYDLVNSRVAHIQTATDNLAARTVTFAPMFNNNVGFAPTVLYEEILRHYLLDINNFRVTKKAQVNTVPMTAANAVS